MRISLNAIPKDLFLFFRAKRTAALSGQRSFLLHILREDPVFLQPRAHIVRLRGLEGVHVERGEGNKMLRFVFDPPEKQE